VTFSVATSKAKKIATADSATIPALEIRPDRPLSRGILRSVANASQNEKRLS
jgi:hypothetical protein